MEIYQLVIGIFLLLGVKLTILKVIFNSIRKSKLSSEELKFDEIRPIYKKLVKNKEPDKKQILKSANNIETRTILIELLLKFDKIELFPKSLLSLEKISESHLANWLKMDDDFDSLPDEIVYFSNIRSDDNSNIIVYKFKTYEPHILANKGWMYGYVVYNNVNDYIQKKPDFIKSDFKNSLLDEKELNTLIKK